jgi:hypothetical protein
MPFDLDSPGGVVVKVNVDSRRTRRWPGLVPLALLAAAGASLACSTRAEGGSAPDSARMALVRFELRNFDDVRIVGGDAEILAHGVMVSPDGLRLGSDTRRWGITSTTGPQERLVPWAEIESIHVRRGARGSGVLLGALAGLAIGSAIELGRALDRVSPFSPSQDSGLPILLGMAGGAALGALVDRPGPWQSVYP